MLKLPLYCFTALLHCYVYFFKVFFFPCLLYFCIHNLPPGFEIFKSFFGPDFFREFFYFSFIYAVEASYLQIDVSSVHVINLLTYSYCTLLAYISDYFEIFLDLITCICFLSYVSSSKCNFFTW